jgi:ribosomal protein L22
MSYHLTLLRSAAGRQIPISFEEAKAAAAALEGWTVTEAPPILSIGTGERQTMLRHADGELWTDQPTPWTIEHMLALAPLLQGRVRGDEFETYRTADAIYRHPDDRALKAQAARESAQLLQRELRLQRRIRNGIFGFFLVLGVIGYWVGKQFEK